MTRQLILGTYATAAEQWTLTSCVITKAPVVQKIISVPGRYAPIDASAALTGEPEYGQAVLTATLELSAFDRPRRRAIIDGMVQSLDGLTLQITHPDHLDHYLLGRVEINEEYCDLAHAAITVTANCDPWFYAKDLTQVIIADQTVDIINNGRLTVVPTVTVEGIVTLEFGSYRWDLTAGEYLLPEITLLRGTSQISVSGSGTVTLAYREGLLAV